MPERRIIATSSSGPSPRTTITVADPGWWICPGQKILRWTLAVLGVLLLSWIVRGFLSPHRFREGAVLLYAESHDALLEIRDGDDGHRPFRRFPETKRGFRRNAALHLGGPRAPLPSLKRMPDDARLVATGGGGAVLVVEREDAVERFTTGENGKELLNSMTDYGFQGLGYWSSGLKQFSANKPLLVPDDAKGLKFRVQTSDVAVAMIEAMGANAQKLAFKEVYGALQTGVVDGQENSWSNIYTQKFFEVQDGITETNHQLLAYLLVTSTEWLNGLDDDVRTQFLQIVDEVTQEANAAVAETEAKNRQNILDAGGTIRELSSEQRKEWVDTMKPVWAKFEDDIGKDLIDAAAASNDS